MVGSLGNDEEDEQHAAMKATPKMV